MVKRSLSLPFRFICLTEIADGIRPEVEVLPLPNFREPAWEYARYCSAWRKLALFEKQPFGLQGKVMFLDLDVIIVGNIDFFQLFRQVGHN